MPALTAHKLLGIWFGILALAAVTTKGSIFCNAVPYILVELMSV
jgi:hypothetical protein